MKNRLILIITLFISFLSCKKNERKVTIDRTQIFNSYWNEFNFSLRVDSMYVKKDSVLDIFGDSFDKNLPNHWNISNKLETDSTHYFGFTLNYFKHSTDISENAEMKSDENKIKPTVYFNKNNGFTWYSSKGKQEIIGELKNDCWYRFSQLTGVGIIYFVYVDSSGVTYSFQQNLSNY